MFYKGVHNTTLTSEVADRLFHNITASNVPDQSFLATLRALLHKRLLSDETVKLTCKNLLVSSAELTSSSVSQYMNVLLPDIARLPAEPGRHNIYIVYTRLPDVGEKMLEIIRANAGNGKRYMSEYTRRDDLQVFYARKAKALFYTDATGHNTIIFADKLELKHFHALQMMIPKYLPQLFAKSPLTETETNLLKSLGNKSAVEYETLIEGFAKDFDIRAEIIRSKLAGFKTAFERIRANELRSEIKMYQEDYERHLSSMQSITNKIQAHKYTLAGLEIAITEQSGDTELIEYFMCNKNLTIIRVSGTAIEFIVHGYADIYDEDAFERYVSNHNGYMYADLNRDITRPEMEKLYRAIFSDGKYKLRICAAYRADMRSGLKALQYYDFPAESQTYMPNPHIQSFGCIGTYFGRFQEYMQNRDYVGGIDQAVISARNLNFYDSSVISMFAADFSRTSIKCIEKSDGSLLTPIEAIKEMEGEAICPSQ